MKYLMIRANRKKYDQILKNEVAVLGWSRINFSEYSTASETVKAINCEYKDTLKGHQKRKVEVFKNIKKGDKILIPCWGSILLGEAQGEESYDVDLMKSHDQSNQHRIRLLKNAEGKPLHFPRAKLSNKLQASLKFRGTILDLEKHSKEIDNLFNDKSYQSIFSEIEDNHRKSFCVNLLKVLKGNNGLKAGGRGLEELIAELLIIDNYQAEIQSKQKYSGKADADIEATYNDRFGQIKLLIQVKHHTGTTETWGAKQLQKIRENTEEYSTYKFILVTTASPSPTLESYCEENDIQIIDGEMLAEWVYEKIQHLTPETKTNLKISMEPSVLI